MKRNKKRFFDGSCIYLIVDELADLMLSAERKQIEKHLQHLAQIGRAANVHLIFATQIIRAETLKTTITGNINGRFALQTETTLDSQKIINSPLAASLPKHGKCIIKTSNGLNYFEFPYYNEQQVIDHVSKHKKTLFDRLNPFF